MSDIRGRILDLLKRNARVTNAQIASRLKTKEAVVQKEIRAMEAEGILRGYTAIVNEEDEKAVRAIIEVEVQPERDCGFDRIAQAIAKFPEVVSMYLVSGRYDLRIEVVGKSLRDVADFVASKLSSQDGVKSTATAFLLKKYKESGISLTEEEKDERLQIVP